MMIIENTQPCTTETQRLTPVVAQQSLTTIGIGLITCGVAMLAGQLLGPILWGLLTTSSVYRTLQIYWIYRGWIALAVLCVGFAYGSVYSSNRQPRSTRTVRIVLNVWRGYCIRQDVEL